MGEMHPVVTLQFIYTQLFHTFCRDGIGGTITVAVGTNQRQGGGSTREVAGRYAHPEFNRETQDFDILLLKMSEPFEWTDYVLPICLPSADMDSRFGTGTMCMATGWGSRFEGGLFSFWFFLVVS